MVRIDNEVVARPIAAQRANHRQYGHLAFGEKKQRQRKKKHTPTELSYIYWVRPMKEYSKQFLTILKKQDAAAFWEIYDTYVDIFYRYIKAHYKLDENDVQDILSDIFVKIWQTLPRIDLDWSLSWFLRTIAKNHIIDHFKRHKEISFWSLSAKNIDTEKEERWELTLQDPADVLESCNISFTHEKIQEALEKLDENYRDPLVLKFVEDLSYEEISQTLGISQDTVRQRISRWLKKLIETAWNIQ